MLGQTPALIRSPRRHESQNRALVVPACRFLVVSVRWVPQSLFRKHKLSVTQTYAVVAEQRELAKRRYRKAPFGVQSVFPYFIGGYILSSLSISGGFNELGTSRTE